MEKIIAYNLYKAIISMYYFDMVQRYIIINKKMEIKSCILIKKNNRGKKLWKKIMESRKTHATNMPR